MKSHREQQADQHPTASTKLTPPSVIIGSIVEQLLRFNEEHMLEAENLLRDYINEAMDLHGIYALDAPSEKPRRPARAAYLAAINEQFGNRGEDW